MEKFHLLKKLYGNIEIYYSKNIKLVSLNIKYNFVYYKVSEKIMNIKEKNKNLEVRYFFYKKYRIMVNYIIVFKNTHDAMNGENILKGKGVSVVVMPTPTSITKSCGISIRFKEEDLNLVDETIESGELEIKNIYMKNGQEFKLYR